ncbi:MAG: twin-arginine translocation signal domain-containing protein, partial [Hyphomicrobium sp.]
MDRRSFLKTTTAAAAASAAIAPLSSAGPVAASEAPAIDIAPVAAPAILSGVRELVMAMPWRDSVSGPADQAFRIARRLEAALDGRWRITPRQHGFGGLEAVMVGDADLTFGTENQNLSFHPAFAYFAALPGAGPF